MTSCFIVNNNNFLLFPVIWHSYIIKLILFEIYHISMNWFSLISLISIMTVPITISVLSPSYICKTIYRINYWNKNLWLLQRVLRQVWWKKFISILNLIFFSRGVIWLDFDKVTVYNIKNVLLLELCREVLNNHYINDFGYRF